MNKILKIFLLIFLFVPGVSKAQSSGQNLTTSSVKYYGVGFGDYVEPPVTQGNTGNKSFSSLCTQVYTEEKDGNTVVVEGVLKPNRITANVVRCAEFIISYGSNNLMNVLSSKLSNIVFYAIVLAVMFYAIKMMFGAAKEHGMTLIMALKIITVLYFCSPTGFIQTKIIRDTLIDFPKSVSAAIMASPKQADGSTDYISFIFQSTGLLDLFTFDEYGHTTSPLDNAFDKFDALILRTFLIKKEDAESETAKPDIFIGLIALTTLLIASGSIGITLAVVVITYLLALVLAIAELALYFIVISVAINLLAAITPLALACMLFKATERITKIWVGFLLVYTVQPIVLTVFLVFTMIILEDIVDKQFQPLLDKVEQKIENSSANPNTNVTIFNCAGIKNSDSPTKHLTSSETWDRLRSQVSDELSDNIRYNHGNISSQDYKELNQNSDCKITKDVVELDDDVVPPGMSTEQLRKRLTLSDIKNLLGLLVAMIFLMVMLISFIRAMPKMVNSIIGQAGADVGSIVTKPTEKILRVVESSFNTINKFIMNK